MIMLFREFVIYIYIYIYITNIYEYISLGDEGGRQNVSPGWVKNGKKGYFHTSHLLPTQFSLKTNFLTALNYYLNKFFYKLNNKFFCHTLVKLGNLKYEFSYF